MCGSEHRPVSVPLPLCSIGGTDRRGKLLDRFSATSGVCGRGSDGTTMAIVLLTGELDAFVAEQVEVPLRDFVRFAHRLVLDASGVSFIDRAGLRLLERLSRLAREAGGSMQLHDPSTQVVRLIRLVDAADSLDVCRSNDGGPTVTPLRHRHAKVAAGRRTPSPSLTSTYLG